MNGLIPRGPWKREAQKLIRLFPCSVWSSLRNCFPYAGQGGRRKQEKAAEDFAVEIACIQQAAGRYYVIENHCIC